MTTSAGGGVQHRWSVFGGARSPGMGSQDSYARLSLRRWLELLAFEAGLARFPRSLTSVVWEAVTRTSSSAPRHLAIT